MKIRKKSQKPLLTLSEQPGEHSNQFILTPIAFSPWDRFRMASKAFLLAITRALSKILGMTQSAEIVELFSYVPKRDKITEGVLFLMEKARTNGQDLTKAQLVTVMFLADKTLLKPQPLICAIGADGEHFRLDAAHYASLCHLRLLDR